MPSTATRLARLVDDYLLVWVLLAVGAGLAMPSLGRLTPLSTPLLAVMVGSVSLTLSPARFRAVRLRPLVTVVIVQLGMPLAGFAVARLLGLSPALTAGFVVLGAVTPELVTPTMTAVSDGDTALSTVVLVVAGVGTLAVVPGSVALLAGDVGVEPWPIVEGLVFAVLLPMTVAVGLRARFPARVGRYDDFYPSISGVMVVVVIAIVTAANAGVVWAGGALLGTVLVGALALNGLGYAAGWVVGGAFTRRERIAATLSVGMRDFAVAAALLAAAGFPPAATLPAVVFGIVEMATSAGLSRRFRGGR